MAKNAPLDLATVLKTAEKKYDINAGKMSEISSDVKGISMGNIGLDSLTGVWGLPLGRSVELYGPPSSGKAQRWTDMVHTPDRGFVQIRDLRVGDKLSSPRGHESTLSGIFPQGDRQTYRVSFSDGTSTVATAEHLWEMELFVPGMGYVSSVITTEQMIRKITSKSFRPRDIRLPAHRPVEMPETDLPLPGYTLGALLGDGGLSSDSPIITSVDSQILERVESELEGLVSMVPVSRQKASISYRLTNGNLGGGPNPLTEILRGLGVWGLTAKDKRIPQAYLRGSVSQRLDLLRGLMDTDGYGKGAVSGSKGTSIYYTSSPGLAKDVAELARSLGLPAFIKDKIPTYFYKKENREGLPAYRVEIRETGEFDLFHLDRKKQNYVCERKRSRNLVSIVAEEVEACVCIKVTAPDELYFTNDYIPTHNTTAAIQTAANLQRIIKSGGSEWLGVGPEDKIVYADFEHSMDPEYAVALGFDADDETCIFMQPDLLENGTDLIIDLINTGQVRMVIIDSLASMLPSSIAEESVGKSLPAVAAKLINTFYQKVTPDLSRYNCLLVGINHSKEKMGMGGGGYGPPQITTPGGMSPKYNAAVRLEFKQIKQYKTKVIDPLTQEAMEIPTSTDVKVTVAKNKVGPPFRRAIVKVRFGRGFDEFAMALTVLIAAKKLVWEPGGGGRYYFHKLEELGLAPEEWMPRASTGTKRPYVQGKDAIYDVADQHLEWKQAIIDLARQTVMDNVKVLQEAPKAADAPELDLEPSSKSKRASIGG